MAPRARYVHSVPASGPSPAPSAPGGQGPRRTQLPRRQRSHRSSRPKPSPFHGCFFTTPIQRLYHHVGRLPLPRAATQFGACDPAKGFHPAAVLGRVAKESGTSPHPHRSRAAPSAAFGAIPNRLIPLRHGKAERRAAWLARMHHRWHRGCSLVGVWIAASRPRPGFERRPDGVGLSPEGGTDAAAANKGTRIGSSSS